MNMFDETRILWIAWYRLEDYDAILRIMADGNQLPDTFDVWRVKAEALEKMQRRNGKVVVRVFIDPETFPDWCLARGLKVDGQARMIYASLIAKRTVERSNGESGSIH